MRGPPDALVGLGTAALGLAWPLEGMSIQVACRAASRYNGPHTM